MKRLDLKFKVKLNLILSLCLSVFFVACITNNEKEADVKDDKPIIEDTEEKQLEESNDTLVLIELTEDWNELLVKQDLDGLIEMYGEEVSTYGSFYSKEQVLKNKKQFFEKYTDFNQSITGEIEIERIDNKHYKLLFPKRTNYNRNTYDVQGILVFQRVSDQWKIVLESDSQTDKTLQEIKAKKITLDIVEKIVTTSPRFNELTDGLYEAVVANGGITFGYALVGGPNEEDNPWSYSETYDFKLYESYTDRIVTITYFTFDPYELQLYENSEPIEFNRDLFIE
ncbi:MAG: nuclear transport factor 2 family protein [Bacteroidales bacterium]|nr:nuclear transport factor 2 family protein [Bacteroidales bacterium]MDY0141790.1 nuclear transport factor 2 family protein [Bacteroidales bacterium]